MVVEVESKEEALQVLAHNSAVRCVKVRETAEHCPDRVMQQTCHTSNEVHNFYDGCLPDDRVKTSEPWYTWVRRTQRLINADYHGEKARKRAEEAKRKRKKKSAE